VAGDWRFKMEWGVENSFNVCGVTRRLAPLLSLIIAASGNLASPSRIACDQDGETLRPPHKLIEVVHDHLRHDLLGKITNNCLHPMPSSR